MASLEELRSEIDAVDRAIVDLLARRLEVCEEVAGIKSQTGSDVIQPARVREVLATRRQWAIDHGVDADFAEQIFRTLLAETHRIEVAGSRPDDAPAKIAGGDARSALDTVACRIDHVVVAVDDLAGAAASFTGLGFRIESTPDPSVMSAEAGGVHVVLVGPGHSEAVRRQLPATAVVSSTSPSRSSTHPSPATHSTRPACPGSPTWWSTPTGTSRCSRSSIRPRGCS